jgi:4-hydroxybenzoyl-CoA reductase subunit beta
MHALPEFTLQRPASLAEATALLAAEPAARLVAGGTDLLPNLRRGLERPPVLIDLSGLAGFDSVEEAADGSLTIGAGLTLAALTAHATIASPAGLAEAASAAAGPPSQRCYLGEACARTRAASSTTRANGGAPPAVLPQARRRHLSRGAAGRALPRCVQR